MVREQRKVSSLVDVGIHYSRILRVTSTGTRIESKGIMEAPYNITTYPPAILGALV